MQFRQLLPAILYCVVWCCNTEGSLIEPDQVDFETEVVPVLTRFGCNTGACHGAATGRGNFKLSLFGSRPHEDYQAIVHHLEGRRIHPVRPEKSLLLQKPSEPWIMVAAFDSQKTIGSTNAVAMDSTGCAREPIRDFQELTILVEPSESRSSGSARQLRANAMFDSGVRDVTELTTFTAEDPMNVQIDSQGHTVLFATRTTFDHCPLSEQGRSG